MEQTEITKKITLRELYKKGVFKKVSFLRFNEAKYPFVTLLDKNNHPANIYFGKKTAEIVSGTFKEGDDLMANGWLAQAEIIQTENSNGETRFKISMNTGDYSSSSSLEAAFGSAENTEFDMELFQKEFAKVTNATKAPVKEQA